MSVSPYLSPPKKWCDSLCGGSHAKVKSGKFGSPVHRRGKGFRGDVGEKCHSALVLIVEDGCGVAVLVETALDHIAESVNGCSYACDVVEAGLVPFVVVGAKVGGVAYGF